MSPNQLRIIFGKLTDMSFDIARLDTLTRQKANLQGFSLDLNDRATAGIEATIEEDLERLAKLLGFEMAKSEPEDLANATCGTLTTSLAA